MLSQHKVMSAYLQTGQITCHDAGGNMIDCTGSGQDASSISVCAADESYNRSTGQPEQVVTAKNRDICKSCCRSHCTYHRDYLEHAPLRCGDEPRESKRSEGLEICSRRCVSS